MIHMSSVSRLLYERVVKAGLCTGCGACAGIDPTGSVKMRSSLYDTVPDFGLRDERVLPELAWTACPGKGIDYPALYRRHYGRLPENWLLGHFRKIRTGFATDPVVRRKGASGGVVTQVLLYLLRTRRIDAAIIVRQGLPTPREASVVIAENPENIQAAAQSVYIPVPVLDVLTRLDPTKRYAVTCLPDQAAALRQMQVDGFEPARRIKYIIGLYAGTALYPAAIECLLRSHGVGPSDPVTRLEWRAGEWPGHLEIHTSGGKVIRSRKAYYNYLIPFFVTRASLQGMDFTNEFSDLSVGDAWSPRFESRGGGYSVVITRSAELEDIVGEAIRERVLSLEIIDPLKACDMHGHMLDFKKRGSYLRNRLKTLTGGKVPDYGLRPKGIKGSRIGAEICISALFLLAGTTVARGCIRKIPESVIGPVFNTLRLTWKALSRPTKRKGLGTLKMECYEPSWLGTLKSNVEKA